MYVSYHFRRLDNNVNLTVKVEGQFGDFPNTSAIEGDDLSFPIRLVVALPQCYVTGASLQVLLFISSTCHYLQREFESLSRDLERQVETCSQSVEAGEEDVHVPNIEYFRLRYHQVRIVE